METLRVQPLAFWISLVAALVSISSLILTYKNSRRSRQLDSLQKRSQLLFKLTDAKSKVLIAKLNLIYSRDALRMLSSNSLLNKEDETAMSFFPGAAESLKEMEDIQDTMEKRATDLEEIIDGLRAKCDTFTENTDARQIEKLLPQAQHLQAGIDSVSSYICCCNNKP